MTTEQLRALMAQQNVIIVHQRDRQWYNWLAETGRRTRKQNMEPLGDRRAAIQSADNRRNVIIVILPENIPLPIE